MAQKYVNKIKDIICPADYNWWGKTTMRSIFYNEVISSICRIKPEQIIRVMNEYYLALKDLSENNLEDYPMMRQIIGGLIPVDDKNIQNNDVNFNSNKKTL